ncbi:hypothetical protein DLAC_10035 [Tieghemostelium lacteum]|uniref:Thioesterase domain-containing protein n=1 Tax=Tieghemostelium lacteum TaxID=361077 RepID=A0A151Z6F3_TIELA|nr:hypothetical protein DLAC_10035 [Tieghemostelium lacteum]|eukprot:KYQ89374.1 hypothetical protein DLAC_10035 [Tieghemostelium lacteum]
MTFFKALKGSFLRASSKQQQNSAVDGSNGHAVTEQHVASSSETAVEDYNSFKTIESDDDLIQWPMWFESIINGNQQMVDQYTLISRNGLDKDQERQQKGFKGRNFVYQDRKFISKYYWKGESSLIPKKRSSQIGSVVEPMQLDTVNGASSLNTSVSVPKLFVNDNPYDQRMLVGVVYWKNNCEGPPGCVHGGALASLFDDSMACCIRYFYNNNYDEKQTQPQQQQQLQLESNIIQDDNSSNSDGSSIPNSLNINNKFLNRLKNHESIPNSPREQLDTTNGNVNSKEADTSSCSSSSSSSSNYAVTVNLSVDYKKFVRLESFTHIETKIEKREGKKIFVSSVMKDQDGIIRAKATAIWIVVKMDN